MLAQIESVRDQERSKFNQLSLNYSFLVFKRRDPEGKFVINNVLMNGHAHMLEYILENWMEANANLPLTLEGNTTVLHQAMCRAAFIKPEFKSKEQEHQKEESPISEKGKKEKNELKEETLIKMIRLLLEAKDKFTMISINVDEQDRLGKTVLHLAA